MLLGRIFNEHYAVRQWLFWRYTAIWGYTSLFCLATLSSGNAVVTALAPLGPRVDGHVTLSFATGVFCFFLLTFLAGIAALLRPAAFVAIPALLIVAGLPQAWRDWRRWRLDARQGPWLHPFSFWEVAAISVGAIALVVLYLPSLIPENAAYDSRWYHLGLAEHYVAQGAIRRLPEGPVVATIPHLASILYTWAFLLPGSQLFDRVELCAHLEYVIFLFTLAGIPLLVRHLVPGVRARVAWVALFLFPSMFVYDSTLTIAADHVAALWVIPIYLLTIRAVRDFNPRVCLLLAIQMSALLMTKYTGLMALIFPALVLTSRGLQLAWRGLRGGNAGRRSWLGPVALVAAGLLLSTPHWLKNWLWYGDPLYPMLHRHLTLRPWSPRSAFYVDAYRAVNWAAVGTAKQKLLETLSALYNYSYKLYHWVAFHGRFPIVGSLFTFLLIPLPFVRRAGRVWVLVIATHLGIAFWYLAFHNDRYLQILLPWMAAGVAAMAVLIWREGRLARVGLVALIGLQAIWGLDIVFWPTHRITGRSGIALAAEFFSRSFSKDLAGRTKPFEDFAAVGRALPSDAKLVIHHQHTRVGYGVMTVTDWLPVQFGIEYGSLGSSAAVHRLFKQYGVTHVTWVPDVAYGDVSLADELVFHTYVSRHAVSPEMRGSHLVAALPKDEPGDDGHVVFYFGCNGTYGNGLYDITDLNVWPASVRGWPHVYPRPRQPLAGDGGQALALAAQASHAVLDRRCPGAPRLDDFERVADLDGTELMVRKRAGAP